MGEVETKNGWDRLVELESALAAWATAVDGGTKAADGPHTGGTYDTECPQCEVIIRLLQEEVVLEARLLAIGREIAGRKG